MRCDGAVRPGMTAMRRSAFIAIVGVERGMSGINLFYGLAGRFGAPDRDKRLTRCPSSSRIFAPNGGIGEPKFDR